MLKKHWRFFNWNFNERAVPRENNNSKILVAYCVILFFLLMILGSLRIQMNIWNYLFVYMGFYGSLLYRNGFGRFERVLPVKDSFVVNNILFVTPIMYGLLLVGGLGLFFAFLSVLFYISHFDGTIIEYFAEYIEEVISSFDILRLIFSLAIVIGIWSLMALQIFYNKQSRRLAGHCGVAVLFIIFMAWISSIMKSAGVTGEYNFSEVIYVLPTVPTVAAAVAFALVSGVYSWNRAMYLYRQDVAGQAQIRYGKGDSYDKSKMALYSEDGKKARLFVIVGGLAIATFSMAMFISRFDGFSGMGGEVIDSGSGEVHVNSSAPKEYGDWDSYLEREGVPKEAESPYYEIEKMLIFPSDINEEYIKEYYAKIDGDYSYEVYDDNDGEGPYSTETMDIQYARFMVADYPKDEFEKECDRLANLTYKYDYDDEEDEDEDVVENHVLVNDDNFPAKTYIAVYNSSFKNYEYAIADENTGRIIYVFLKDCGSIPTDTKYRAERPFTVVPLAKRNYGKGYSIY